MRPMHTAFFLSAFAWNFALSMSYLLVPLYALDLGYSGLQIGSLIGRTITPLVNLRPIKKT